MINRRRRAGWLQNTFTRREILCDSGEYTDSISLRVAVQIGGIDSYKWLGKAFICLRYFNRRPARGYQKAIFADSPPFSLIKCESLSEKIQYIYISFRPRRTHFLSSKLNSPNHCHAI